jgi:aspartyl-tRNA(Asn)/glutamyl-tRNA(Gln) amidotransferase subunit A
MSLGSIGTDTGGSVRIPAAACGVVGLKPTYGEVSVDGIIPLAPSLDHVGVLASNVYDAFLLYAALRERRGPRQLVAVSLVNVRIGVLNEYFCDMLDRGVAEQFDRVLHRLSGRRAHLVERRIEGAERIPSTFAHLQAPEAYAHHAPTLRRAPELFTPNVRARIERGAAIAASDYVEARHSKAALTQAVEALFDDVDVLVLPTLPIPAPPLGADVVRINGRDEAVRGLMMKMTQLFNITGHPAISIPCGRTPEGLPVGLQLVAPLGRTVGLLEIALGCERVLERLGPSAEG